MDLQVQPNIVKIWKKYVRMRNSYLYNFHIFQKTIALTI